MNIVRDRRCAASLSVDIASIDAETETAAIGGIDSTRSHSYSWLNSTFFGIISADSFIYMILNPLSICQHVTFSACGDGNHMNLNRICFILRGQF